MCLLTYFPEGIHPDTEALARGARYNADGHGFAIVVPADEQRKARIIVRKSMKATSLIKEFVELRKRYPKGPALFHSRITTDGATNLFNCHPFMHSGDKRTVIGHNGILPWSVRPTTKDKRSDTRIFAEEVAGFFKLNTIIGRRLAGEWMGDGNKIVILSVDPAYALNGYIVNEASGMWDGGVWYSNSSYKGYRTTTGTGWTSEYYGTTSDSWGKWTWCELQCGAQATTVSPHTAICTRCRYCMLCYAKPCECELEASMREASGKGMPPRKESSGDGGTVIGGSPAKGATVAASRDAVTTTAEYLEALEEAERQGQAEQLAEAIALVDHLNKGGELEDWPVDSSARSEVERWLSDGDAVLVDGVIKRVAMAMVGDGDDDQNGRDYLIHNGTKYAL